MRGQPCPAEEQHFLLPALHIPGVQALLAPRLWQGHALSQDAAGCPRASPKNSTRARPSPAGPWNGSAHRLLPGGLCQQQDVNREASCTWGDVRPQNRKGSWQRDGRDVLLY